MVTGNKKKSKDSENESREFNSKEFLSEEILKKIHALYKECASDKSIELEAVFKKITYPDYMRLMEILMEKTPEDSINTYTGLDISFSMSKEPINFRISLTDEDDINNFMMECSKKTFDSIKQYISKIPINEKTVELIYKKRDDSKREYIDDYDLVIKSSQEEKVKEIPDLTPYTFMILRYKDRVTFNQGSTRIDLTVVHEAKYVSQLFESPQIYELELEVVEAKNFNKFLEDIEKLLKLIQKSSVVIKKSEALAVIEKYCFFLNIPKKHKLDDRRVISIQPNHIVKFIPNKYAVSDKPDGERYFMICYEKKVYLISSNMMVKKTNIPVKEDYDGMILDGELIDIKGKKVFFIFDILYVNHDDYRYNNKYNLPYRLDVINSILETSFGTIIPFTDYLDVKKEIEADEIKKFYTKELKKYWTSFKEHLDNMNENTIFVTRKLYFIPYGIDKFEIFMYAQMIWELYVYGNLTPYAIDGLIFTPLNTPYMIRATSDNVDSTPLEYKWKPPKQNSIDFYIRFVKDENGEDAIFYDTENKKSYKICNLMVGDVVNNIERPVNFIVNNEVQKSKIYLEDDEVRDIEGKIINDETVVEFCYDISMIVEDDSFKWIPMRTRYDKTEAVMKYKTTYGNNLHVANRIWKTINNPITEDNIFSLANPLTFQKEINKLSMLFTERVIEHSNTYYEKKTNLGKGMRLFNNWIKRNMIGTYCSKDMIVLDMGCGRGGDLDKILQTGVKLYVGTDVDINGLYKIKDSALNRYLRLKNTIKGLPPVIFINADSKALFNLPNQMAVISTMDDRNKRNIETYLSGKQRYNMINCQFSIHYYLSDEISWKNFCKNINDHLADNGYLLITCFDGDIIRKALKDKSKISASYTDKNGVKNLFFEITKAYSDSEKNNYGQGIDVYNAMINEEGKTIREYLVDPAFIIKNLKEKCGLTLVESDSFVNLFNLHKNYFISSKYINKSDELVFNRIKDFYLSLDPKQIDKFDMETLEVNQASYKFTSLNRYYVFRKTKAIDISNPSRIIMVNNSIRLNKIIDPYLDTNNIKIDLEFMDPNINNIYHRIIKEKVYNKYGRIRPYTYLLKHSIPSDEDILEVPFRRNKVVIKEVKEGDDNFVFMIYKSPDNIYYPVYQLINETERDYLFTDQKILEDLRVLSYF